MIKLLNKHLTPAIIAVTAVLMTVIVVSVYASVLPRPYSTPKSIAPATTSNPSAESDDDEKDDNGSNVTGKTTVKTDAASSASLNETNGSTPSGSTAPGVDAAASASVIASATTGVTGTTTPTTIDAVASASQTLPGSTTAPTTIDATAGASQPQPGSTTAPSGGITTGSPAGTPVSIPLTQAQAIAVSALGGSAQVKESEMESEHGVLLYKIKLVQSGKEFEVMIQASTGAIIEVEQD